MITPQLIFYVFSAMAIVSGLMVVTARQPVHSALFLVLAFVASAGLWLLMEAEFLALILVLVYVGAVMTLFLFVVMMLSKKNQKQESYVHYLPFAILLVLVAAGAMGTAFYLGKFNLLSEAIPLPHAPNYSNIANLGSVLYTQYVYPFEVAGILLLTAIIAAICLTHQSRKDRKNQIVSEQLKVTRNSRVRLVKMPPHRDNPLSGDTP